MRTIHLKSVQFNGRDKFYMGNFALMRTKLHFFVPFNSEEKIFLQKADHLALNCIFKDRKKITAKVNAFMLPDGEVDLNFQKGDE